MPIQITPDSHDQIVSTIRNVAVSKNVDFKYLLNQAKVESGLNPLAKAPTSSAMGLFQFTSTTWLNMVKIHGDQVGLNSEAQTLRTNASTPAERSQILELRSNPLVSTALAAHLAVDNARALAASGHASIGPTELYMAHFLGSAGANVFLNGLRDTPSAPAANALPAAAAANAGVFFANRAPLSFQAIYDRFSQKFAEAAATNPTSSPQKVDSSIKPNLDLQSIETSLNQIINTALSVPQSQTPAATSGDAPSTPVSEGAMKQYLKNFSLVDQAGGMSQIEHTHTRDASQAAVTNSGSAPIAENDVSPMASGVRMILKAAEQKTEDRSSQP